MQRMLESGPLPVYGMPRVSRSACTVPSSPPGPCRQTKAASGASSMSVPVVWSSMSRGYTSWPAFEGVLDAAARDEGHVALHGVSAAQDCQACHGLSVRAYGRADAPVRAAFQVAPQLHALPDHLREQLYAAPDPLRLHEREVEPHV